MIILRDYQGAIVDECATMFREGVKSLLIQAPTGSGKTALAAEALRRAAARGNRSLFVVHRRELIRQSVEAFSRIGLKHGIIAAGFPTSPGALVQIAAVQTLVRRLGRVTPPKLIFWDEAHHCAAGSWQSTYTAFPGACHIGLTATPQRLDGRGLRPWFKRLILGPTPRGLIDRGYLSDYRCFAPPGVNVDGMRVIAGDYARNEMSIAADRPTITGSALEHYQRHAAGKRAIVFCCSIQHSLHVASQFAQAGISAAHVDGETPAQARDEAMERFRSWSLKVMCNVDLFGEGVDVPGIEAVILLRPTKSLGLYLQQVGRSLRPAEGKTHAVILDHAGNVERHGLPDDERHWSLDGRAEQADAAAVGPTRVKTCPSCFAVQRVGPPKCFSCGLPFPVKQREVDHVNGELRELDAEAIARKRQERSRQQGAAETFEDLVDLGKSWGHRNPWMWARHIFAARQRKKLQGAI